MSVQHYLASSDTAPRVGLASRYADVALIGFVVPFVFGT